MMNHYTDDQMNEHPSTDQLLLDRLNEAIDDNLQNEQFGVPELADAAGLSKSQLNRKLQSLTTQSASQFIREYRLKKAMELLQSKAASPTEVSYKVGFGSPSYFSTCFKEFYGYSPNEVKLREDQTVGSIGKRNNERNWQKFALLAVSSIVILILAYIFLLDSTGNNSVAAGPMQKIPVGILPAKFLDDDSSNAFIAEGITRDVAAKLTEIPTCKIFGEDRTSYYAKMNMDMPEIGSELGAQYLIEIIWFKFDKDVQLTANLIDAEDGSNFWSESYDQNYKSIARIGGEVAIDITKALGVPLTRDQKDKVQRELTSDPDAYTYYLRGQGYFLNGIKENFIRSALASFEKAVQLDSGFAQAWMGLSTAHFQLYGRYYDRTEERYNMGVSCFEKAKSLNPDLLSIKLAKAEELDTEERLYQLKELLAEYPNNDTIYNKIGVIYNRLGEYEMALDYAKKAIEIEPMHPRWKLNAAMNCTRLRKYEKALEYYKQAVALLPTNPLPHLAMFYLSVGDLDGATHHIDSLYEISGGLHWWRSNNALYEGNVEKAINIMEDADTITSNYHSNFKTKMQWIGLLYFINGNEEEARQQFQAAREVLEKKMLEKRDDHRVLGSLAIAYAGLGMKQEAVKMSEEAIAFSAISRPGAMGYRWDELARVHLLNGEYKACINVLDQQLSKGELVVETMKLDPLWDPLRKMPEFQAMINNPEYAPVP